MKKNLETRTFSAELEAREEGKNGIIIGRPIVYNSRTDLGYFDEVIEPGALDGADLSDVRLCLNHDTDYVYARSRRNNPNSTMRLSVDMNGMQIEADLDLDAPASRNLYSAVGRGDLDKMSFMFSIEDDEWEGLDTDHPLRHIKKIGSVVETSIVTFPAYDATSINIARSKETLERAKLELESARRSDAEVETSELELLKEKLKLY